MCLEQVLRSLFDISLSLAWSLFIYLDIKKKIIAYEMLMKRSTLI